MKKQTRNIIITLVGLAVLSAGIMAFSSSFGNNPIASAGDASLKISEKSWNFGTIPMSEGIVTREVQLSNDSSNPMTITDMETSCMCTTAQVVHEDGAKSGIKGMPGHGGASSLSETVAPGETVTLLVNFDPNAHGPSGTGLINRTVSVKTNSAVQPEITLSFSGNVVK